MRFVHRLAPVAVALLALMMVLPGLTGFGIWDPWELEAADSARRLLDGEQSQVAHAGPRLASVGFALFGIDEGAGRLPIAAAALLVVALTAALAGFIGGRRVAIFAALIAMSSPLFVLNARLMLGEAPSFAAQAALALTGLLALSDRLSARARAVALVAALFSVAIAVQARGALLGALPPLVAVVTASALEARWKSRPLAFGTLAAVALALLTFTTRAILVDPAEHSVWLGGGAVGGQPPSFDAVLERVLHAFAPWSALLPLALGRIALSRGHAEDDEPAYDARLGAIALALWIALGYAAQTLFLSRYGREAAFLPLAALAVVVALFLRDVERLPDGHWPLGVAAALFSLLLVRDYALYPIAPVHGLGLADFKAPEGFNPRSAWGAVLGVFSGVALLGLGAPPVERLDLLAPYRFIATAWRRGLGHKLWCLVALFIALGFIAYGVVAWTGPSGIKLTTQARKWGKALAFVPLVVPIAIGGLQLALLAFGKLGTRRPWAVLIAGVCVGLYTSHGFMPKLSAHFSPRDVYETYNALAKKGEPLVEYRVGGRAAAYYAHGEVAEVDSMTALMRKLEEPRRTWAVMPTDELAAVDRMFRRKAKRHLFGADLRSGRVMLVATEPVQGRKDENPLATTVLSQAPKPQHASRVVFDGRIELIGYDLALPHGDHVGAGERFSITWYFRALRTISGEQKMFVHVDGDSQRIHGDHHPVGGTYPVRFWDEGDVIVDKHELEVPSTYRPATFDIFLGFYAGETRMPVTEGPKDDANRARVGVLRIR